MDSRSSIALTQPRDVMRRYVEAAGRAVHYRVSGDGPAIVMLHDSPRSSRLHLATMRTLSQRFRVYALDTPGYGNSEPLRCADPTIADFASALDAAICALGIEGAPIYATHTSAKIALEYAASRSRRDGDGGMPSNGETTPGQLILDGLSIPAAPADPAFVAKYMRPFVLDDAGGYLAAEWTRMRDMLRWFPWFDRTAKARMPIDQPTDAWISAYMIDYLSAGPNYASAYAAAMLYDPMPALLQVTSPVLVAARTDDVLYGSLDRVPVQQNTALAVERLPADGDQWLEWLENALYAAVQTAANAPALPSQPQAGATYVAVDDVQMRVHRSAGDAGRPVLILSAPTTLQAFAWQAALPSRTTIVPELPGFAESDPLPSATLEATADALAAMLVNLGYNEVDVLATGDAAALGCVLAKRQSRAIRHVVLDACHSIKPDDQIAPAFPFDTGGGHIHRYWHMLRDGEVNWPWYDGAAQAARQLSPALSAQALHDALVGILKQPERYGDVSRAACQPDGMASFADFEQPALLLNRPNDPSYGATEALAAQLAGATVVERPAELVGAAQIVEQFLAQAVRASETMS